MGICYSCILTEITHALHCFICNYLHLTFLWDFPVRQRMTLFTDYKYVTVFINDGIKLPHRNEGD
jgi:hypothetical protein